MTRQLATLLAALLTLAFASLPAGAQTRESIVDFHSEIWVNPDASLTVRETITVDSARRKIRRGIFRDFPTIYENPAGRRSTVGFELQEITRDGAREPYHTERQSNGVRIYIGAENVLIPAGRHVYRITYRTTRQLGFFDDFDELFWNVTGNGWDFPVERARATVHLPTGARVIQHAGYTGREGERGQDFRYFGQTGNTLGFESTRELRPGEGLTVAVAWPTGFVARPSDREKLGFFLSDNRTAIVGALGLTLLLVYYLVVWSRVGRDPDQGPVAPQYEPPQGISPAGSRYVRRMGFDDKAFTAAIISMAVKGFLTIKEQAAKAYTLERTRNEVPLSKGEAAIVSKLFPGTSGQIELKQKNHKRLQAAKSALQKALRNEFEKVYFVRNTRHFLPGIGISLLTLVLLVAVSDEPETAAFISLWLSGWTAVVYYLFRRIWRGWRAALAGGSAVSRVEALFVTLFALPFFGGEVMGFAFYAEVTTIGAAVAVVLIQFLNALFYHLLKAPTRLGRRTLDDIEGFEEFLSVAEKDRMNLLNPPERTPELFERFLPYSLALGVEQQWAEQFSGVLAQAAAAPTSAGAHYRPRWYSGRSFDRGFGDCVSTLGGGFASAISAASTAPGSSSGSGGGGSSGGGGGGGGGGGW